MENSVTVADLINYFKKQGLKVQAGDASLEKLNVAGPRNIKEAKRDNITFVTTKFADAADLIRKSEACVILVDQSIINSVATENKNVLVASANPKADLIDCLNHFFSQEKPSQIERTAQIHDSVRIGKNVSIGHYTVIEENVIIGDDCIIESNVHIKKGTEIGNRVEIKSSSVIGGDGFGYNKSDNGSYVRFPHFGKVIIEDDVSIGSCTCIDRGSLSDTIIRKGVKIDNLVHVAHNVEIGENSLVIACSLIGGSTVIGKNCWLAPSVTLRNNIVIGDDSLLGMGSVITKSIPAKSNVTGIPARDLEEYKKLLQIQKDQLKNS